MVKYYKYHNCYSGVNAPRFWSYYLVVSGIEFSIARDSDDKVKIDVDRIISKDASLGHLTQISAVEYREAVKGIIEQRAL